MGRKLRIIVGGFIGLFQAGGVTWDYIQYPLGFSLLGHDVYYLEDTRMYPIFQINNTKWDDSLSCINHLERVMNYFGFKDKWAYRDEVTGKCYGLTEKQLTEICKTADVFINVSCSTVIREEYSAIPVRILIDSDPMFTQIQLATNQSFTSGTNSLNNTIKAYSHFYTFGENMGKEDCLIPKVNINWQTTRQPICLKYWTADPLPAKLSFTTLMNWTAGKNLLYNKQEWGQKDVEFLKIISLPKNFPDLEFSVAINITGGETTAIPLQEIKCNGWHILDPSSEAGNWKSYQQFITHSAFEFSVSKETYAKAKTGWFSCRSACYLASGRPVITQNTGWNKYIPEGSGLLSFEDLESAKEAVEKIIKEKYFHSKQARKIAEEFFNSSTVLNSILNSIS